VVWCTQRQGLSITQIYDDIASSLGHRVLNRGEVGKCGPVEADPVHATLEIHDYIAVIASAHHEDVGVRPALEDVMPSAADFENRSTQYQNGVDMHLDWGASQFLTKQFFAPPARTPKRDDASYRLGGRGGFNGLHEFLPATGATMHTGRRKPQAL
jgi:hypothetical protein